MTLTASQVSPAGTVWSLAISPQQTDRMEIKTIDDIYTANDRVRARFAETIDGVSETELKARPEDEKWSIEQIVEHVSLVEEGMSKICRKLLGEAQKADLKGNGEVRISDMLWRAGSFDGMKLEAPERVRPTGLVSVDESRTKMEESRLLIESLRPIFAEFDGTGPKFPHPYFGPMSAQEWLVLSGEHTRRHTAQIENLIAKIRQ